MIALRRRASRPEVRRAARLRSASRDPPAQNVVGPPAVMVAVGSALTVTLVAEDGALQPFALVTVTL